MTYKPTGKCLVPGILHFRLHEWTLFNCTITVCLKTHFQVCPENGTKKKAGEKTSTALPRMWPRHTTITQTIWCNICFPFRSWSCISCECCGWWEVRPACVCVCVNITAPYTEAKLQILSCTYGCRGNTILHHDVWLCWQEERKHSLWTIWGFSNRGPC